MASLQIEERKYEPTAEELLGQLHWHYINNQILAVRGHLRILRAVALTPNEKHIPMMKEVYIYYYYNPPSFNNS